MNKQKIIDQIFILAKESTLMQGTIAVVVTVTICYLFVTSKPVPSELYNVLILILGFYFGSKSQAKIMKGD